MEPIVSIEARIAQFRKIQREQGNPSTNARSQVTTGNEPYYRQTDFVIASSPMIIIPITVITSVQTNQLLYLDGQAISSFVEHRCRVSCVFRRNYRELRLEVESCSRSICTAHPVDCKGT